MRTKHLPRSHVSVPHHAMHMRVTMWRTVHTGMPVGHEMGSHHIPLLLKLIVWDMRASHGVWTRYLLVTRRHVVSNDRYIIIGWFQQRSFVRSFYAVCYWLVKNIWIKSFFVFVQILIDRLSKRYCEATNLSN